MVSSGCRKRTIPTGPNFFATASNPAFRITAGLIVCVEPISKFLFITGPHPVVIPAEAGIHVFQGLQWTPVFTGVTYFHEFTYFEIGSIHYFRNWIPRSLQKNGGQASRDDNYLIRIAISVQRIDFSFQLSVLSFLDFGFVSLRPYYLIETVDNLIYFLRRNSSDHFPDSLNGKCPNLAYFHP